MDAKPAMPSDEDKLIERALEVLGSDESARLWLNSRQKALGGRIPIDLLSSPAGVNEVKDLLGRIEHGVFT